VSVRTAETAAVTAAAPVRRVARRVLRWVGNVSVVLGLLALVWAFWTWRWGDPLTGAVTAYEQRQLGREYEAIARSYAAPAAPSAAHAGARTEDVPLAAAARRYRLVRRDGDPVGRLRIPRLGLDVVVVNGTDAGDLRRGPGRDLRTAMPGERQRVYVAGHRTTFGAPFANIDVLRPGDRLVFTLPYATFTYAVVGHRIVDDGDLDVLRSRGREELLLQACHPRFSASQRYIVFARPVAVRRVRA
jgi:sortase A